jgi:hypothetical protein
MILGIKISKPVTKAAMEAIRTPAADISFTRLILSFLLGDTKSDKFSIAEFIASREITSPIAIVIATHSKAETFNTPANAIAQIAATK